MSTPNCTAEERAWLLVYTERILHKRLLSRAFNKQFASERSDQSVNCHAQRVKSCDAIIKSQLLGLAKSMPWYVFSESTVPLLSLVMSLEQFRSLMCFKARYTSSRASLTSKSKLGMKSRHGRDKKVIK